MSDRTHQYRNLTRRDPATTAELYTRDGDGNPIPMATSADGKLVVEVSGGGGGGGGVIQAKAPGATPSDPRVTVDLYATGARELLVAPKADSQVLLRGEVPAVGPTPAYAKTLRSNAAGELAVTVAAPVDLSGPVSLQARLDGSSPPVDVRLRANDQGQLNVAIENSVTVPVEVQGVAEVKATSVNFWALAKGNGPVVIPNFTDADGWFDVRAFSRFSATGIGTGYTYDLAAGFVARGGTVHRVATYAELTAAITAATAGDIILLSDGVYEVPSGTLTIDKSLVLIGESRDGVVIQTPVQAAPGVTWVVTIAADDVEIRNLTVYHRQTTFSGGASETCIRTDAARAGIVLDTLRLRYMEYGLSLRGQFAVRACDFEYELGAANNSHRAIILYGTSGNCEIVDCGVSFGTYATASQGRFVQTGAVAGSDYAGTLVLARNYRTAGRCNSVLYVESLPGTAGAFSLALIGNIFPAEATNVIVITGADTIGEVTLQGNVASTALKGYLGFDIARTAPLVVHESGNTVADPTLRADYVEVYGDWLIVARDIVTPVPTVAADNIIPDLGIPAETGASVLLEDHVHVDVKYRVSMFEPGEQQLASHALNSPYHAIINPEEPKDILGIGYLRLVARDSSRAGHFAVFGSGK